MAVSLLLSGTLTWVLVRQLEFDNAQKFLDQSVLVYSQRIQTHECLNLAVLPSGVCAPNNQRGLATTGQFTLDLGDIASTLGSDRMLLIDKNRRVVYDSQDAGAVGAQLPVTKSTVLNQVRVDEANLLLGDGQYIGAATALSAKHPDPMGARFVVLARPRVEIAAKATQDLVPPLLEAGGVSLLGALIVALLIGRALARPLHELGSAAEDIAAGNYSTRVRSTGGDEIGVVGSAFNRMAEAVERARTLQRDFLANVSHELKTPLTSLIGFSQALMDGSLRTPEEQRRAATILHEEAERVLRMSQELLDLARVESGQLSLHIQPVDLGVQLQQEMDMVRARAEARGLMLQLAMPASLPPVQADPERLHQILDNLLDNAVKYAPEGSEVRVRAEVREDQVETSVRNPVGTHRPDPDRIFDRFYRGDPSRASAAGGVGLGLAISRELASVQGGSLTAHLDEGGDLAMRLLLPAVPDQPAQPAETPRRATDRLRLRPEPRA